MGNSGVEKELVLSIEGELHFVLLKQNGNSSGIPKSILYTQIMILIHGETYQANTRHNFIRSCS